MMISDHDHRPRRAVIAAAVAVAALGLSACGGPTTPPPGAPVVQLLDPEAIPTGPYAGPYDQAFAEDLEHYAEQEVVLRAQVGTVVSPVAFTITTPEPSEADSGEDTGDGGVAAPLLVVDFDDTSPTLRPGDRVEITGTVHAAYNVPDTEENLGAPPGPEVLASYDGQPFLNATSVQTEDPQATTPATTPAP
ncbi:hypothetical protein [Kocuria himachalensis]